MKIIELKCINLLVTLHELQEIECEELGLSLPGPGHWPKLPDGRDGIYRRLWLELIEDQWGNQQFCNDSFYRVPFEDDEDGSIYEHDLSEDMEKLLDHCRDAVNYDAGFGPFLLFDVCW